MLKHVDEVYKIIESKFKIPKRIVRWYVTEKLIPQTERDGKKAYYDLEGTKLLERIQIIKLLQNKFKYSLDDIREILSKYDKSYGIGHIDKLISILENLNKDYPVYTSNRFGKKGKIKNATNTVIQNEFFSKLEQGDLDVAKFSLLDLVRQIKEWGMEEYSEYTQINERYQNKYYS